MKKLIIIMLAITATLSVKMANGQDLKRNCSNYHVPPPVLHFLREHPHFAQFVKQHPYFLKNIKNHPGFGEEHPYWAKLIKNNRGVIQYIAFHHVPSLFRAPQLPNNSMVTARNLSWPSAPTPPAPPQL